MRKLVFVIIALAMPVTTVAKGSISECLTDKYNQYAKAQETWQRNVTNLIIKAAPQYEEVARMYMTDQLRAIERRKLAVEFLARQEPGRLRTQMSLNNWLNLDADDHQRIAASDERYAKLLELSRVVRARSPHPDGNGLREVIRLQVMNLDQYDELLKALMESVQTAEEIQCQSEHDSAKIRY